LLVGARCAPYNELLAEVPQLKIRPGSLGKAGQIDLKKSGKNENIGGVAGGGIA
jgi:hypothetical protein